MGEEEEEEAIEGEGEGDERSESEAKMSRKEKRKERKKMKRKQVRREAAEKERDEEERRINDPEEQRRLKEAEELEKERAERERKAFEERERAWLEEMETRRKLEEEEEEEEVEEEEANKLQVGKGSNCLDNDEDEWEYVEEGPAEIIWQGNEIIVRKKKVKVPKKTANRLTTQEDDANRPISNPLPPQSEAFAEYQNSWLGSAQELLENVAQQVPNFGTEQDKAHCPFHLKTGACRFGQRCSRAHFYPDKACTLLIKNMYNGPGLAWEQDEGLEYTDEEVERSYEEFYEDVHTEFLKYGELVNFKVCKNGSFHLRGNVYVHYKSVDSAVLAYHSINGRYFAGKQVMCEFVNVTRWKVAICGEYMKSRHKTCSRGTVCNFIHCFRNPGGDYEWADWDKPPPRYWVKKMAALFGDSNELAYEKQMEPENLKSASKRKPDGAGRRHRARTRSQDMDQLIPRSSSVAEDDVQKGTRRRRHVNDHRKLSKFLDDEENPRDRHQRRVNDYRKQSKFLDYEENPRDHHHGGRRKYDSGSDEGCLSRDVGRSRKRRRRHGHERKRSKCSSIMSEGSSDSLEKRGGTNLLDSKEWSDGASFDDGDRTHANKLDGYKDLKKHSSPRDRSPRLGIEAKGSLDAITGTGKELCRDKDKHRCRHKCRSENNSGNRELIGCPTHEYHDTGRWHGSDSSDDQFHRNKKRSCERGSSEVSDEESATLKRLRESSHGYTYKSHDSDSRYSSAEPSVMEDRWEPQNHDKQYDWRSEPHDSIGDYPDNGTTDRLSPHKSEKRSCERALDSQSNFALDEGYYISKSTSLDRKSSGSYKKSRATDRSHRRSKRHSSSDEIGSVCSEERQEVDEKLKKHHKHRSHVGQDHEK